MSLEIDAEFCEELSQRTMEMAKTLDEEHRHLFASALRVLSVQADVLHELLLTGAADLTCIDKVEVALAHDAKSPEWLDEVLKAHGGE